jgi:signal transduction histidine kinase
VADAFPRDTLLADGGYEAYVGIGLWYGSEERGVLVVMDDRAREEDVEDLALVVRLMAPRAGVELTEARRAEEAQAQRALLELAAEATRMVAFRWSPEEGLDWTAGGEGALHVAFPGKEVSLASLLERIHPEDREIYERPLRAALRGERDDFEHRFRTRDLDGGYRWVFQRGRVDRAEDGSVRALLGVSLDVSESQALTAELRRAQRMEEVGLIAGGLAHDFNNLFTTVLHLAELATMADSLEEARASAEPIVEAVHRAARLTRRLLTFARAGGDPERFGAADLMEDLLPLLHHVAGKACEVSIERRANPHVRMDGGALDQVLMNLVSNARDASPSGGPIVLSIDRRSVSEEEAAARGIATGPHALLTVRDRGEGMAPETMAKALTPFFTTKHEDRGTGLGLTTCARIVRGAGGALWLESGPDEGTTAVVLLPEATG